jgi:diacylglycerol kinase family enzyme
VSEELLGLEAMNVRELGPNLPLAPDADPGDGLLDVVLVRSHDRDALAAYVAARLRGEHLPSPALGVRHATACDSRNDDVWSTRFGRRSRTWFR